MNERRMYLMKKIFKNLAKHFAKYGQYSTVNLGL